MGLFGISKIRDLSWIKCAFNWKPIDNGNQRSDNFHIEKNEGLISVTLTIIVE
jgi:hypothetical protein